MARGGPRLGRTTCYCSKRRLRILPECRSVRKWGPPPVRPGSLNSRSTRDASRIFCRNADCCLRRDQLSVVSVLLPGVLMARRHTRDSHLDQNEVNPSLHVAPSLRWIAFKASQRPADSRLAECETRPQGMGGIVQLSRDWPSGRRPRQRRGPGARRASPANRAAQRRLALVVLGDVAARA